MTSGTQRKSQNSGETQQIQKLSSILNREMPEFWQLSKTFYEGGYHSVSFRTYLGLTHLFNRIYPKPKYPLSLSDM